MGQPALGGGDGVHHDIMGEGGEGRQDLCFKGDTPALGLRTARQESVKESTASSQPSSDQIET